jgi:hypothetical protein
MFAARMTLPHFSISVATSWLNMLGAPGRTAPSSSASRALIVESARAAFTARLSLSVTSGGVFLGAPIPYHALASNPATDSLTVGVPGSDSARFGHLPVAA